jgi:hypothetical protein
LFLIIGYYVEKNSAFFVCSGEAEHGLVEVFYLPGRQTFKSPPMKIDLAKSG